MGYQTDPKAKDETGNRYGRLVVVARHGIKPNGLATWLCRCDCGVGGIIVTGADLRFGRTRSCGCLKRQVALAQMQRINARRAAHGKPG